MGPTWGPHGSCRLQVGPTLAPWTLLSGYAYIPIVLLKEVPVQTWQLWALTAYWISPRCLVIVGIPLCAEQLLNSVQHSYSYLGSSRYVWRPGHFGPNNDHLVQPYNIINNSLALSMLSLPCSWSGASFSKKDELAPQQNYDIYRDHFVYAPSQWEMKLHCNITSHWLGICTKWSLHIWMIKPM